MIGRSQVNERLQDMTPNGMLVDVSVSSKNKERRNKTKKDTTNISF